MACTFRDAIIIAVGDTIISIFAGIVIFAFIGYMAEVMGEDITNVVTTGRVLHQQMIRC